MNVTLYFVFGSSNGPVELFTNYKGEMYVPGYWGRHNTFANVPASTVLIVHN